MNNSRSHVYRGDFRKPVYACEFTHVSVFMRTRLADSHFAVFRLMYRFPIDRKRRCIRPWECRPLPVGLLQLLILGHDIPSPFIGRGISPLILQQQTENNKKGKTQGTDKQIVQ